MTTSRCSSIVSAALSLFFAAALAAGCDVAPPDQEAEQITQAAIASPTASAKAVIVTDKPVGWTTGGGGTGSAVEDPEHCPERVKGNGVGSLVGGMCLYPVPKGGCSALGDDCNTTHDIEPMCRCEQKNNFGGGTGSDPAQVLTSS